MTEELKKEAKEYTKNLLKKLGIKEDMLLENQPKYLRQESMNFVALDVENVTDAYLAGAEPREKQIDELKAQIKVLEQNLEDTEICENGLKNRIAELEAQIEKMKCCGNCKYYQFQNDAKYCTCTKDGKRNGKYYRSCEFNLEKWEGR